MSLTLSTEKALEEKEALELLRAIEMDALKASMEIALNRYMEDLLTIPYEIQAA